MTDFPKPVRCAIYTRKSSEEGLDQEFNSIDAQREACEQYINLHRAKNWVAIDRVYDDGGFSGGTLDRPAVQRLMRDIEDGLVDLIVVYKIDRLSRSLLDFAQLATSLNQQGVSVQSVSEAFNTHDATGSLMLNVLMSFAQYEREVAAERIRDKIAASKRKGYWMGGNVPFGYSSHDKKLVRNPEEAASVEMIFAKFLELGSCQLVAQALQEANVRTRSGKPFNKASVYKLLNNPIYRGLVRHKEKLFEGRHDGLIGSETWAQVEAQFATNPHKRANQSRARTSAPLKGLIFDAEGRAMSPSHTRRSRKIYRYYISRSLLKGGEAPQPGRVNASQVEEAVVEEIRKSFGTPQAIVALSRAIRTDRALTERDVKKHVDQWALLWDQLAPHEQSRLIELLVCRVVVHHDRLQIEFNPFDEADNSPTVPETCRAA